MEMEFAGIQKLRGAENWTTWKFVVSCLLGEKENALEVCEGTIVKPVPIANTASQENRVEYEKQLKAWDRGNRAAKGTIVRTLEANIQSLLVTSADARGMWIKLHSVFEQQTQQAALNAQKEFFDFGRNLNTDMATHIAKLENLILKMDQLRCKPQDSMIVIKLLSTLSEEYEPLRQAWMARPSDQQTLANLVGLLMSEESRRLSYVVNQDEMVALMTKTNLSSKKRNNIVSKGEMAKNKPVKGKCFGCGEAGHYRRDCTKNKKHGTYARLFNNSKPTGSSSNYSDAFVSEMLDMTDDETWIIDTGATDHMAKHREWFSTYTSFKEPMKVGVCNKTTMEALGKGIIKFQALVDNVWRDCHMENVLHVPEARRNLFAVNSAIDKGMQFLATKDGCEFIKDGITRAIGVRSDRLMKMVIRIKQQSEVNVVEMDTLQLWHERLGHQNKRHVQKILKQLNIEVDVHEDFCSACVKGKQHRLPFRQRTQRATRVGDIIHTDVCGPMEQISLGGARYFVCFTDDYSKYRQVYFLKEKSQVQDKVDSFIRFIEKQSGHKVKELLTDGGLEFNNKDVQQILQDIGVKFRITNPYTPQQNGCAERTNRTIVELARTMLLAKNLPKALWAEAVNTAVYILNRTGPSGIDGKTPHELFFDKHAHIEHLHIFGTECYVHVPKVKRQKWDAKGKKGILVGYSEDIDGYRICLAENNVVVRSRDVTFGPENTISELVQILSEKPKSDDEETEKPQLEQNSCTLRDRRQIKPKERLIEMMMAETTEPRNYIEAIQSADASKWKDAMDEEMASLEENETWTMVELPEGRRSIPNRWVYKVKCNESGEIDRFKARLVIKGYSQKEGVDFQETFSPVARYDTIRTILSVAANENLHLAQFDIKTAFLYGQLEEEIYMDQPEGYKDGTNRVCRLLKSLYGLKQAPRCWNTRFTDHLLKLGFKVSSADPCLFLKWEKDTKLLITLYVDDGLVAATDPNDLRIFLELLKKEFKVTIVPATFFLGMQIKRMEDGSIFICQEAYAKKALERFNMADANPVATPVERSQLSIEETSFEFDRIPYREAVGTLMYLAVVTRPDIAFAVSYVSQFLDSGSEHHWAMVKRILKYIKGTTSLGILYKSKQNAGTLEAYSDSDYASDPATRRSVTGNTFKYSGGAISWNTKRQPSVALSTTEAEYMAACEAAKEIIWLKRLFDDISPLIDTPVLQVDNASTIRLVKNPEFHKRSKHIDVRYHFIRELYREGKMGITHVASDNQVADILTKAIPKVQFQKLRNLLGMYEMS